MDGETIELSREHAGELWEAVGDALTSREEFFRTAAEYREDGSYVIERRGSESTSNSVVFDSFADVCRLFDRLPETFDAENLSAAGFTGSRRHMLVRHFAEHPAFPCTLASRTLCGVKNRVTS